MSDLTFPCSLFLCQQHKYLLLLAVGEKTLFFFFQNISFRKMDMKKTESKSVKNKQIF